MASGENHTLLSFTDPNVSLNRYGIIQTLQYYGLLPHIIVVFATLYVVARIYSPAADIQEPPLVSHPLPFVGHLIGILTRGIKYFDDVGQKVKKPIFTLPVLNGKTYVITSPELVVACMRETKTLSFNPFVVEVFRRFAGLTDADMETTRLNMDSKSIPSYMSDVHRVEYASLAPGSALDQMNEYVLNELSAYLQTLSDDIEVGLYESTSKVATICAFRALYGPESPFENSMSLRDDFWLFERDLKWLLLDMYPNIICPKANAARRRMIAAFLQYYKNQSHFKAAAIVRGRLDVALKYGQKLENIAAFDVGLSFGLQANSVPTMFWVLAYICHDPDLLDAIRKETSHLVDKDSDPSKVTINLQTDRHLRTTCPLLTSTFHETLRIISSSLGSGRYVLSDTVLTAQPSDTNPHPRSYLLKKGATVQIPSESVHHPPPSSTTSPFSPAAHPSFLDSDIQPSSTFDARRFLKFGPKLGAEPERSFNGSFRAFGGGTTLCPGRKFAFMESVGLAVLMVHCFDIDPSSHDTHEDMKKKGLTPGLKSERTGQVGIPLPQMAVEMVALAVSKPKTDVQVRMRRREMARGRTIEVCISGSETGETRDVNVGAEGGSDGDGDS